MEEWMEKMRRWCSQQERSTHGARRKLQRALVDAETATAVVRALVEEGFLSDERFLDSYVRTHMEYKRWGPRKIAQGLREVGFAGYEAEKALNQVDGHRFREILAALVERRKPELAEKRERVIRYLLGRGFLVNEVLRAIEEAEER